METMKTYEAPTAPAAPTQAPTQTFQLDQSAQPVAAGPTLPPADLAYSDPTAYNSQLKAYHDAREKALQDRLGQQLAAIMQPLSATVGTLARSQIAADPEYKDVFSRWGHEIDQEFANNKIPANQRTAQAYKLVVDMVKGRHVKELAQEEAQRILSSGGQISTVRGGVSGNLVPSAPPGDAFDLAWEAGDLSIIQGAKAQGVSKEDMRKAIRLQGHSVDDWVKLMGGDNVFMSPDGTRSNTRISTTKRGA